MKQFLLALFFAAFFADAQAQITVTPETSTSEFVGVILNASTDLSIYSTVTNNSTDTVKLKWVREVAGDCQAGWKTQICDNNLCYNFNVSSNVNPTIGLDAPFVLKPGETFDKFILHVWPGTSAGCCEVSVHFSEVDNPDVVIATTKYEVSVNTAGCFTSDTEEPSPLALRNFPNPATDFFTVSDHSKVKFITVTNLLGKRVRSFNFQTGDRYDISGLPDGTYLVSMKDGKNNILKTQRLSKRSARP